MIEVMPGKIYVHTKGGLYLIDKVKDGRVYYDPLYPVPDEADPNRAQPNRSIEEFTEIVQKGVESLPRFQIQSEFDPRVIIRTKVVIDLLSPILREQFLLPRGWRLNHLYASCLAFGQKLPNPTVANRLGVTNNTLSVYLSLVYKTLEKQRSVEEVHRLINLP